MRGIVFIKYSKILMKTLSCYISESKFPESQTGVCFMFFRLQKATRYLRVARESTEFIYFLVSTSLAYKNACLEH